MAVNKPKYIQILVDEETHKKYRGMLKRRRRGECVKYLVGDAATSFMRRKIREDRTNEKN